MPASSTAPTCTGIIGAAEYLRVHPDTVYRLVREGKIRYAMVGRKYRIQYSELERFLASGGAR